MQLVVARLGRAHGIKGDLTVEVRTDDPDTRFAPGSVLATDPGEAGPLTVSAAKWHSGRLLLHFDGVHSRSAAEALRNVLLVMDTTELPAIDDPDEFYDHELEGLRAELADGSLLGMVREVVHVPQGELLAVTTTDGVEVLVPFLLAFVPVVDVAGGRVVLDPPDGLLELAASTAAAPDEAEVEQ